MALIQSFVSSPVVDSFELPTFHLEISVSSLGKQESVLKKLLRLHQTRSPNRCGNILSLVWKYFVFGVEIFCLRCGNFLSLVWKFFISSGEIFSLRSYPTIETKNLHTRETANQFEIPMFGQSNNSYILLSSIFVTLSL